MKLHRPIGRFLDTAFRKRRIVCLHETLPWPRFFRRLQLEISKDNVFGRAGELGFFFLFSVFPLLLALTNLLGMISEGGHIRQDLLQYFQTIMPWSAYQLVASTLSEVTSASGGGKLSLGIVITLASASSGMVAVIEALNTAYEVREVRPWWRRRVVALVLTVTLALFTILALAILLYGSQFGRYLAKGVGLGPHFEVAWTVLRWPLMAVFVLAALSLVYRFAPNVRDQKWHWVLPGAVAAFLLWFAASVGLRLYLRYFDRYSATYGSLGAVIILMLWLYLFSAAILIGGEVNSIIEQAAARAGDPEAKLPGEREPGESRQNRQLRA
jgi:membrane protein